LISVARALDPAANPWKEYPVAASKAGAISFSITLTREPAYRTSTGPDPLATVEADGTVVTGTDVGAVDLFELPQAAASSETVAHSIISRLGRIMNSNSSR
jgi:hypothetical protein